MKANTDKVMKIVSYNVNGLRAAMRKGMDEWVKENNFDIICLQEIKGDEDKLDFDSFEKQGYQCFAYSAHKKGYSGTAILTRNNPDFISKGMGIDLFDSEGRLIRADYGDITLICAYFPSGSSGDERQAIKMQFLPAITNYLQKLRDERPNIILGGDFNICREARDINFPKKHEKMSGFLPEERAWFADFVKLGWVDTFREFHQESERYSWWSYRAKAKPKNLGWRIDYWMITEELKSRLKGADILEKIDFSDHCPVTADIEF